VLSFVLGNSIKKALDLNYRAAQLLMEQRLVNMFSTVALDQKFSTRLYRDVLTTIQDPSLYSRYGAFGVVMETKAALELYRDILVEKIKRHNLDVAEFSTYCDSIINTYIEDCALTVNSSLSAAQITSARFVSREEQSEQEEIETNIARSSQPEPRFDLGRQYFAKNIREFMEKHFYKNLFCDYLGDPNISLSQFMLDDCDKVLFRSEAGIIDFYKASNVSQQMYDVQKHVYYVVEYIDNDAAPVYSLIDEENKDLLIHSLSGLNPISNPDNWKLDSGEEIHVYNIANQAEFHSVASQRTLPLDVLLRVLFYNADINQLISMMNDGAHDLVKAYFDFDTNNKLEYLKRKVFCFRPDQKLAFKEFKNILGIPEEQAEIATQTTPVDAILLPHLEYSRLARNLKHEDTRRLMHSYKLHGKATTDLFPDFKYSPYKAFNINKNSSFYLAIHERLEFIIERALESVDIEKKVELLAPEILAASKSTLEYLEQRKSQPGLKPPVGTLPSSMYAVLLQNASRLEEFCRSPEVYRQYLTDYYGRKKPFVPRDTIFETGDARTTSYLDLIAFTLKRTIELRTTDGRYCKVGSRHELADELPQFFSDIFIGYDGEHFYKLKPKKPSSASAPKP
jgi:hypothetical protein